MSAPVVNKEDSVPTEFRNFPLQKFDTNDNKNGKKILVDHQSHVKNHTETSQKEGIQGNTTKHTSEKGPNAQGIDVQKKAASKTTMPVVASISSTSTISNDSSPSSFAGQSGTLPNKTQLFEQTKAKMPGKPIIRSKGPKRKKTNTGNSSDNISSNSSSNDSGGPSNPQKKIKLNDVNSNIEKNTTAAVGRSKLLATGRWTEVEHNLFKQGLEIYGKEWNKVAELVRTRTVVQTRTHAQKYFQRLLKAANLDQKELKKSGKKLSKKKTKINDALVTPIKSNASVNKGTFNTAGNKYKKKAGTNKSTKEHLKRSPAASALLLRTSAGSEAIMGMNLHKKLEKSKGSKNSTNEEVMADSKYLELAKSGTASTSKKSNRGNLKRKKKNVSKKDKRDGNKKASPSINSKKRPKPSLIGLSTPREGEVFGKYGQNVPETPWAGHVALLKQNNDSKKKKKKNGLLFLGNKSDSKYNRATQRSLRHMPAKRTMIHDGILTGDVRGLTSAIRAVKGEVALSPRASPTASSSTTTDGRNFNAFRKKSVEFATDTSTSNDGDGTLLDRFNTNQKLSQLSKLNPRPSKNPPILVNASAKVFEDPVQGSEKNIVEEVVSNMIEKVKDFKNQSKTDVSSITTSTSDSNDESNSNDDSLKITKSTSSTSRSSSSPSLELEIKKPIDFSGKLKLSINSNTSSLSNSCMSVEFVRSRPQLKMTSVSGGMVLSVADYVNHPDKYGYTPLMLAASLNEEYFKQIKKTNKNDAFKKVPIEMVKILFHNKASAKYIDKAGYSCLHWAAAKGNTELCSEFLNRGSKINLQGNDGNTPLHLACCEGRVETVKYLLKRNADASLRNKWGRNAIELAAVEHRVDTMSHRKAADRLRSEIRSLFYKHDASWRTLFVHHPECQEHQPRKDDEWEHPERIDVIMKEIEQQTFFDADASLEYSSNFNRANVKSLLRVHSTQYIKFIHDLSKQVKEDGSVIPFTPKVQKSIGGVSEGEVKEDDICDTSFSTGSLPAARRAVGAVCYAVDRVVTGKNRNAFCAVRPPGHHAGISGLLKNATSCGFCIFNNVAVGALHALDEHNLQRVAILDFDVHHGNGTEEIINKFADPSKLFFFSIHLYDRNKSYEFYPGTGKSDFLLRNIVNAPMKPLWRREHSSSSSGRGKRKPRNSLIGSGGRQKFRQIVLEKLLPALRAYNPELILLSSGFDGSENDVGNCNHTIGARSGCGLDLRPVDYYWAASKIQEIADICCNGRIVSVLEGGYGQMVRYKLDRKNLANCVTGHVAALVDHKKAPLFPRKKGDPDSDSSSSDSDEEDREEDESLPDPTYDVKKKVGKNSKKKI
jgi:SHAQKYF class myb-like DNA-binding protein